MLRESTARCGTISLIGAPNVGKSSLVNTLVGKKISIVTHKAQTTRTCISGVIMVENTQLIIVDTPGIFTPRKHLERAMVSAAWGAIKTVNAICLLVDVTQPAKRNTRSIIEYLKKTPCTCMLILNKIDLVERSTLLQITAQLWKEGIFTDVFMISATKGMGIDALKRALSNKMPIAQHIFDKKYSSDVPKYILAAEITREKLFLHIHQEIPYALTVETHHWQDFKNGDIKIQQDIYVEKESQRAIILGFEGKNIKHIGKSARIALSHAFCQRVHLFLHVKVKKNWQEDRERYKKIGLPFLPQ